MSRGDTRFFYEQCRYGDIQDFDFNFLSYYEIDYGLFTASGKGKLENVKYIIENIFKNEHHNNFDSAFIEACKNGHYEVMLYLLEKGADFSAQDDLAICMASANGHLNIVKHLVSLGADFSAQEDHAIRYACHEGHLEVVKFLVSRDVDVRIYENICLIWASMNGHYEVVKYLVSLGADVHAKNNLSVFHANQNGHYEVVRYLISMGASSEGISEECERYISFCNKMQEKIRERAQKKIYFWIIPKLYDLKNESGMRLMEKNYQNYLELCMN